MLFTIFLKLIQRDAAVQYILWANLKLFLIILMPFNAFGVYLWEIFWKIQVVWGNVIE